jgi:hypothetical protein
LYWRQLAHFRPKGFSTPHSSNVLQLKHVRLAARPHQHFAPGLVRGLWLSRMCSCAIPNNLLDIAPGDFDGSSRPWRQRGKAEDRPHRSE